MVVVVENEIDEWCSNPVRASLYFSSAVFDSAKDI